MSETLFYCVEKFYAFSLVSLKFLRIINYARKNYFYLVCSNFIWLIAKDFHNSVGCEKMTMHEGT